MARKSIAQQNRDQRLQFLNLQEQEVNSLIAQLTLSANRISAKVLEYGSDNPRVLVEALLDAIDGERPAMYESLVRATNSMINLGVNQSVQSVSDRTSINASPYLLNGQQILEEFLQKIYGDSGRLSDLIWTLDDKVSIAQQVREAVASGEGPFQLAERINNIIKTGKPRYTIDRVANTELVRAYSRGRIETIRNIARDFEDEMQAYIEVSLSPYHPHPDICDALAGTYQLGKAPIPPHHPGCICLYKEIIRPSGKKLAGTTTVKKNLVKNSDFLAKHNIDPAKATKMIEIA